MWRPSRAHKNIFLKKKIADGLQDEGIAFEIASAGAALVRVSDHCDGRIASFEKGSPSPRIAIGLLRRFRRRLFQFGEFHFHQAEPDFRAANFTRGNEAKV